MFLESIESAAEGDVMTTPAEVITDQEIDAMIEAESEAEHAKDVDELDALRAELNSLKDDAQKEGK